MDYKIVLSPQAIDDVETIVRKIAKDNPVAAERVGYALLDRVTILESFPFLGSPVPRKRGIRKLVSYPYAIYYRPQEKQRVIDVLRYWHGARQQPDFI
jgi:toxin ParE1/3/4